MHHHLGLRDLQALVEGPTGWYDLIVALSSVEQDEAYRQRAASRRKRKGR